MPGFDNRYPWLYRIAQAPMLSAAQKKDAQRIAKRIGDSTGLSCAFNSRTGDLFFYYGSPHGGPFAVPFYDRVERSCRRYSEEELGDYIHVAKLGQLERGKKDRIRELNEQEEAYRNRKWQEQDTMDRAPSIRDHAAFLSRKRRGVPKVISVSGVVAGLRNGHVGLLRR